MMRSSSTRLDDFLTSLALRLGVNNPLQSIVPVEARMVVSLLGVAGIRAAAGGSNIVVWDALIFHDYGGTMLVIAWLFVFWFAVQRWILVAPASNDVEMVAS